MGAGFYIDWCITNIPEKNVQKNKLTVISMSKSCAIYKNQLMPGFISMLYKDLLHVLLAKITTVKTFRGITFL